MITSNKVASFSTLPNTNIYSLQPLLKSKTTGAPNLLSSIKLFKELSVDQSLHAIGGPSSDELPRRANAFVNCFGPALIGDAKWAVMMRSKFRLDIASTHTRDASGALASLNARNMGARIVPAYLRWRLQYPAKLVPWR